MTQRLMYKIDLTEIVGEGEFPCPSCGEIISPDDESGTGYDILDVKTKKDKLLEEILVMRKKCGSMIRLEGFEVDRSIDGRMQLSLPVL